jgi:hypothetical protein
MKAAVWLRGFGRSGTESSGLISNAGLHRDRLLCEVRPSHGTTSHPATRGAPEACNRFRPSEGVGNAGCPMHPQPVCNGSKHTVVTTVAPEHPAFPHAMVLTVYSAFSPATNSSCHRHLRISSLRETRLGSQDLRRFSTSNGCQDHAASPYATRPRQEVSSAVHAAEALTKTEAAPFVCAHVDRSRAKAALRPKLRARRRRVHRIPSQRS